MSPHIFPIGGSLATSMRLLSENRLTHCSTSNIRTHRWDPAPRYLLFSCFLESLVWLLGPNDIQGSPEHFQTLRSPSRPSGEWAHHFQGWVRQSECPTDVRELQSHFKQGCSDSHCTTPPADFNRCPTSFKRDHYQHSTAPMVTTLFFNLLLYQGTASAMRAPLSITNLLMRLYVLTVQIRPCSHGAPRRAFLLQLPLGNRTDRI